MREAIEVLLCFLIFNNIGELAVQDVAEQVKCVRAYVIVLSQSDMISLPVRLIHMRVRRSNSKERFFRSLKEIQRSIFVWQQRAAMIMYCIVPILQQS